MVKFKNISRFTSIFFMLILITPIFQPIIVGSHNINGSGSSNAPMTNPQPTTNGTYIFYDDFESGKLDSNWTVVNGSGINGGNAWVGNHTANSGNNSMYTRWGNVSVTTKTFNLTGSGSIRIGYWIRRGADAFSEDTDSGEDLIIEYMDKNNTWITLDRFLGGGINGQIYNVTHNITENASHGAFKLRFSQTSGSSSDFDYWHIDDVYLLQLIKPDHDIAVQSINIPKIGKLGESVQIKTTIGNRGKNNERNITVRLRINGMIVNSTNITFLNVTNSTQIIFNWLPAFEGDYNVVINVTTVIGENFTANNELMTTIKIIPQPDIWTNPHSYNISVMTGNVTNTNLTIGNYGLGNLSWRIQTQETIFSDDFEDGDYNDWTNGSGTYIRSVTSSTAANGTAYSFSLKGGNNIHENGVIKTLNPSQPEYISFYVRTANSSAHNAYFLVKSGSIIGIFFYAMAGGRFHLSVGSSYYYNYNINTWYHIEFKNINWSSYKFDYYINDVLQVKQASFRSSISNMTRIDLYNLNYAFSWFDEIIVGTEGASIPDWIEITPNNGTITPSNRTKLNITINASAVEPGLYKTKIIIDTNDLAHRTVQIPMNITVLSAPHDIRVLNIDVPKTGEAGKDIIINATIFNQGICNETNITIQLKADGTLVNSTIITNLQSGNLTNISLSWKPMIEKNYIVEICSIPVINENATSNNQLNRTIQITAEPDIWINPEGYNISVMTGNVANTNLTIGNSGLGTLYWQILTQDIMFSDDFEDGNYDGWLNGSGTYTRSVTTTTAAANTQNSFTLSGGSNSHQNGVSATFNDAQPEYIGFYLRSSSISNHDTFFRIKNAVGSDFLYMFAQNNGRFYISTVAAFLFHNYTANTWYHFELKNINWTFHTLDFYINNTLIQSNHSFSPSIMNISQIYLYNWDNSQSWYDEIIIGSDADILADWLTISPNNGTVTPLNTTLINITANATLLEPGLYNENITIKNNDPIDKKMRIPINFTVLPAPHDIRVLDISVPKHGKAGKNISFSATILNQGTNNETNITVELKINGIVKNSTNISSLSFNNKTCITLGWIFMVENIYSIEIHTVPIPGENRIINNQLNSTIEIKAEPDIWLSDLRLNITTMAGSLAKRNITLGNNGLKTLDFIIRNDLYSKEGKSITTQNTINDTLSFDNDGQLGDDFFNYIYIYIYSSDDDTLDCSIMAYNGSKWVTIYSQTNGQNGVVVNGYYGSEGYTKVRILLTDFEYNDDINYSYKFSLWSNSPWLTFSPSEGNVSQKNSTIIQITVNASLLDPGFYTTNLTIFSNDPVHEQITIPINLTILRATHDIRVLSITVPKQGEVGKNIIISATILNQGKNNEANINIQLKIDGVVKNNTIISSLNSAAQTAITLGWSPINEMTNSVEIYAVPVTGETSILNNILGEQIDIFAEPDIWYSPSGFNISALVGTQVQDNLTIGNDGYDTLEWEIGVNASLFQSFESTTFDSSFWSMQTGTPAINTKARNEPSEPYSLNLDGSGDTVTSIIIDFSKTASATLEFYYERGGGGEAPDSGDYIQVEYKNSVNVWNRAWIVYGTSTKNSTFEHAKIKLPKSANHASFQFRFTSQGSGSGMDDFFIDNIYLNYTKQIPEWLKFSFNNGSIPKNNQRRIPFWVDARNSTAGIFNIVILLNSNDLDESLLFIPFNVLIKGIELEAQATDTAPIYVRQDEKDIHMLNITFRAYNSSVTITSILLTLTGSAMDNDIDEVRLIEDRDYNGNYNSNDIVLGSGEFNLRTLNITGSWEIQKNCSRSFFVLFNISTNARIGNTAGVSIFYNDIIVSKPASIMQFYSFNSIPARILQRIDYLAVSLKSIAPEKAEQGQGDVPVLAMDLKTTHGTVTINTIRLEFAGTGDINDVTEIKLILDENDNDRYDKEVDLLLYKDKFSDNYFAFSDLTMMVNQGVDVNLLILFSISSKNKWDYTVGATIKTEFILLNEPDIVQPFEEFTSELILITPNLVFITPSAPTGLTVTTITHDSISLRWLANSESDVIGYNVYRSNRSNPPNWSAPINGDELVEALKFTDSILFDSTTYYYVITAVTNFPVESDYSDTVFVTTLGKPTKPRIKFPVEDFSIQEDSFDDDTINLFQWFTDDDGDKLRFWSSGEVKIEVDIDENTGAVRLTPKHNWNGKETIRFYASDENDYVYDRVKVTITGVNDPPGPVEIVQPSDGFGVDEDKLDTLVLEGKCTDPDCEYGDELTFEWYSDISGSLGVGNTIENLNLSAGPHKITLEVTDKSGKTAEESIYIYVKRVKTSDDGDDKDDDLDDSSSKNIISKDDDEYNMLIMLIVAIFCIIIILILLMIFALIKKKNLESKQQKSTTQQTQEQPIPTQPTTGYATSASAPKAQQQQQQPIQGQLIAPPQQPAGTPMNQPIMTPMGFMYPPELNQQPIQQPQLSLPPAMDMGLDMSMYYQTSQPMGVAPVVPRAENKKK